MTISNRSVVVRTGAMLTGHVEIHIEKQFVDENGAIVGYPDLRYHVLTVEVGADVDTAMAAVNQNLIDMGIAEVAGNDIEKIKAICDAHWTPDVVEKASDEVKAKRAAVQNEREALETEKQELKAGLESLKEQRTAVQNEQAVLAAELQRSEQAKIILRAAATVLGIK